MDSDKRRFVKPGKKKSKMILPFEEESNQLTVYREPLQFPEFIRLLKGIDQRSAIVQCDIAMMLLLFQELLKFFSRHLFGTSSIPAKRNAY